MPNVGELWVKFKGDRGELSQALQAAKSEAETVGQTIDNVMLRGAQRMQQAGRVATVGLTLPLALATKEIIKTGAAYVETISKTDVVFEQSSQKVKDWAKTTIDSVGLAESTALDMISTYGDMATSIGFTNDQAAEMGQIITERVGDLVSFKDIRLDIADTALTAIFTGETESLKRMGVIMTQTNLDLYAMENGYAKTTKEMSQQELVALRLAYVMEQTGNAAGDYERTSSSAANQMKQTKELTKELAVSMSEMLLPAWQKIITGANNLIRGFKELGPAGKKVALGVMLVAGAAGPAMLITAKLTTAVLALKAAKAAATKEMTKETIATLTNTVAQKGQGAAMFQAGLMATGKAAAVTALGVAETATTTATYALGTAVRFLTGPLGIVLGLIAIAIPTISSLGKVTKEAASTTDDLKESIEDLQDATVSGEDEGILAGFDAEQAIENVQEYADVYRRELDNILIAAKQTHGQITSTVEEEYKKQREKTIQELQLQKAEAIALYAAQAAEIEGLTDEEFNSQILAIQGGYDQEIAAAKEYSDVVLDIYQNHYTEAGGFTEDGLRKLRYLNDAGNSEIEKGLQNSTARLLTIQERSNSDLSGVQATALSDMVKNAGTAYSEIEQLANDRFEAEKNTIENIDGLSASRVDELVTAAAEERDKVIAAAQEKKDGIILAATEEIAGRQNVLHEISRINEEMYEEEKSYRDEMMALKEEGEIMGLGKFGIGKIDAKFTDEQLLEQQNLREQHNIKMTDLNSELATSFTNLDTDTVNAYADIMLAAEEAGIEVPADGKEMAEDLVAAVENLPTDLKDIAIDTYEGFLAGMKEINPQLIAQAEDTAAAIVRAFKKILKINSPSYVMRKDIVGGIGEGVVLGFKDITPELETAAMTAGTAMTDSFGAGIDEIALAQSGAINSMRGSIPGGSPSTRTITNTMAPSLTINGGAMSPEYQMALMQLERRMDEAAAKITKG